MKTKTTPASKRPPKGTPTHTNVYALAEFFGAKDEAPNRVAGTDAPHLRRCLAAGLARVETRTDAAGRRSSVLAITPAGRSAVVAHAKANPPVRPYRVQLVVGYAGDRYESSHVYRTTSRACAEILARADVDKTAIPGNLARSVLSAVAVAVPCPEGQHQIFNGVCRVCDVKVTRGPASLAIGEQREPVSGNHGTGKVAARTAVVAHAVTFQPAEHDGRRIYGSVDAVCACGLVRLFSGQTTNDAGRARRGVGSSYEGEFSATCDGKKIVSHPVRGGEVSNA